MQPAVETSKFKIRGRVSKFHSRWPDSRSKMQRNDRLPGAQGASRRPTCSNICRRFSSNRTPPRCLTWWTLARICLAERKEGWRTCAPCSRRREAATPRRKSSTLNSSSSPSRARGDCRGNWDTGSRPPATRWARRGRAHQQLITRLWMATPATTWTAEQGLIWSDSRPSSRCAPAQAWSKIQSTSSWIQIFRLTFLLMLRVLAWKIHRIWPPIKRFLNRKRAKRPIITCIPR